MMIARMLSMACALSLSSALFSMTAAAQDDAGEQSQQQKAAETAKPTIKLLEAGEEPRVELRYRPSVDTKENTEMRMQMRMTQGMNGMEMPPMSMPQMRMFMEAAVDEIEDNGNIKYTSRLTKTEVREDRSVNPMIRQQIMQALRAMEGLKVRINMSNQGVPELVKTEMPDSMNPMAQQQMEGLMGSFEQMATPFPDEPVGKGARWEVKSTLTQQGMTIQQTTLYTIKSISGSMVELDVKTAQTAEEQDMENPMLPPGATVRLMKFEGNGEGTSSMDLNRIAPKQMQMKSTTRMELSMLMGDQAQEMQQRIEIDLQMREDKPKADDNADDDSDVEAEEERR